MAATLKSKAEICAEQAESLSFCRGTKLLHIRSCVEELLSFIGRSGLFEEYTLHNISHIDEMLSIVDWLIPNKTKDVMTSAEWLTLTLAIYFHDLGMLVTKKEYANRFKTGFKKYKDRSLSAADPISYAELSADDHFLYQEFVREHHAKRICSWIDGTLDIDYGDSEDVFSEIQKMLSCLDPKYKKDLALLCESHHEDDIENFEKYKTKILYGNDPEEKVNLNYIAIILRIADLLHITRDRTPSLSMRIINVTNPKSLLEWKKQMAVRAVAPQTRRDEDGNVDDQLEKNTIEITAYFDGADTAEAYFGLSAYLKYTQNELSKCHAIVNKAKKVEGTCDFDFPWQKIDDTNIETVGFETKKLQFTLEQESILKLLVGHTLYNDSSVVVRELIQNSIDAVKLQNAMEEKRGLDVTSGKITVQWDSETRILTFSDNGTGMTISDIENYLLKVGASKYRETSLKKEFPNFSSISRFGIGILTCFMIADEIDITTNSTDQREATIVNLRNLTGTYLLSKVPKKKIDSFIQKHGTTIELHVRKGIKMSNLHKDLKKWIVLPDIPVYYREDNHDEIQIGFNSLRDTLVSHLASIGITVDGKNYDIFEGTCGNVSVAFVIRHLKYLSDWSIVTLSEFRNLSNDEESLPIGTCIEGIRVEFTSPGYTGPSILAIANVKGGKYRTNVARSAIELDANKELLSDIYTVYASYLQKQMETLRSMNFSESWALNECQYLMRPLLHNSYERNQTKPVDESILIQCLSTLDCLILESSGSRSCISAGAASKLDEINIFECQMLQAVQFLFREIPSSASLNSIMNVVSADDKFLDGVKNVVCNYDVNNVLHKHALEDKEVSHICVNRNQRRIHLTFSNNASRWDKYESRFLRTAGNIFIPKDSFVIEGLDDEIGVKTIGGIYLNSNSELCYYIIRTINSLKKLDKGALLTYVFLQLVFQPHILENTFKNDSIDELFKSSLPMETERYRSLWKALDVEEFSTVVLAKNYSLYSIYNWIRSENNRFDVEDFFL